MHLDSPTHEGELDIIEHLHVVVGKHGQHSAFGCLPSAVEHMLLVLCAQGVAYAALGLGQAALRLDLFGFRLDASNLACKHRSLRCAAAHSDFGCRCHHTVR